jgi:hypothetical protein
LAKCVKYSVVDPWRFAKDPDPRIRTADLRIRILLFSSVADKMPTKNKFFPYYFFEVNLHQSLKIKSHKEVKKIAKI